MARKSEREEHLERENGILRKQIERMREDPGDMPVSGCGDSSCVVARPKGMHTNGGCRCNEHTLRRAMTYWRRCSEFLRETIAIMKDEEAARGVCTLVVPGTFTSCGEDGNYCSETCMLKAALRLAEAERDKLAAKTDVLGGEWCAKNRAEGRGPCGACAWCCKQASDRAEASELKLTSAEKELEKLRSWVERLRGDMGRLRSRVNGEGEAIIDVALEDTQERKSKR